jgi:ribosomal protein S6
MLFPSTTIDFYALTEIMKKVSMEIVKGGGIVRAIHNHGIRNLPHRFRAKYADKEGKRYYTKGRFVSIYYDSNPATMKQVEQTLTVQEEVLRNTHLKARSVLDYVNISREERNPFIKQVKMQQALDRLAIHHRNETVEQVIEDMRMDDV